MRWSCVSWFGSRLVKDAWRRLWIFWLKSPGSLSADENKNPNKRKLHGETEHKERERKKAETGVWRSAVKSKHGVGTVSTLWVEFITGGCEELAWYDQVLFFLSSSSFYHMVLSYGEGTVANKWGLETQRLGEVWYKYFQPDFYSKLWLFTAGRANLSPAANICWRKQCEPPQSSQAKITIKNLETKSN